MQGFTNQILADKLAKLNSSQQSIETLSHWCIFHRRSAKQIVDIWARQFSTAPREQRVPFLFLANDILQNSRRKGGEFVNEFWRALPGALRDVMKHGDDANRSTVLRLIDIWEERKVFGSHPQGLRVELLGRDAPPSARNSDGLLPEKLVAVYKAFNDKLAGEDELVEKCNSVLVQMESLEKEIDVSAITGHDGGNLILEELQHGEGSLADCIQQLEATEIARSSIVFQLKETLRDQEAKLEQMRLLLQAAHSHAEHNRVIQQHIYDALNGHALHQPDDPALSNGSMEEHYEDLPRSETGLNEDEEYVPSDCYVPIEDDGGYVPTEVKSFDPLAAAQVAAKLASSTASAAMLSSVLSSLAADSSVVVAPVPGAPSSAAAAAAAVAYPAAEAAAVAYPAAEAAAVAYPAAEAAAAAENDVDPAAPAEDDPDHTDLEEDDQEEPAPKKLKHEIGQDKVENDALMPSALVDDVAGIATGLTASTSASTMPSAQLASSLWQGLGFTSPAAAGASSAGAATGCTLESYQQSNALSFFTSVPPQQ